MKRTLEEASDSSPSKRMKKAPKETPKRLTTTELLEKIAGPKVDIYVGPDSKHFHLPKDVLCYYSSYFDRCFNGGFKEAEEQKLTLPEDRVESFQLLVDYMFLGSGDPIKIAGSWAKKLNYYMEFIEYCGNYDLLGALQMIRGSLMGVFKESLKTKFYASPLPAEFIETIFRVLPEGHELRGCVTLVALKSGLYDGVYEIQEKTVDGFAVEVLN